MAITLDVHVTGAGLNTYSTSPSKNTSANSVSLILMGQGAYGGPGTLSDSTGSNSYTNLTLQGSGGSNNPMARISYKYAPATSTTHTWTSTGSTISEAMAVAAFLGVQISGDPFDQQNGASGGAATMSRQPGSITPTTNGQLIVTILNWELDIGAFPSVDSGFTIIDQVNAVGGTNEPISIAYLIQGTAAAVNPTWSWTVFNVHSACCIASFKAAASAGGWGGLIDAQRNRLVQS